MSKLKEGDKCDLKGNNYMKLMIKKILPKVLPKVVEHYIQQGLIQENINLLRKVKTSKRR